MIAAALENKKHNLRHWESSLRIISAYLVSVSRQLRPTLIWRDYGTQCRIDFSGNSPRPRRFSFPNGAFRTAPRKAPEGCQLLLYRARKLFR